MIFDGLVGANGTVGMMRPFGITSRGHGINRSLERPSAWRDLGTRQPGCGTMQ